MVRVWITKEKAVLEVILDLRSDYFSYDKKSESMTGFTRSFKAKDECIFDDTPNYVLNGLCEERIAEHARAATVGHSLPSSTSLEKPKQSVFFKGTTFGKSENSYSYVAALLKAGLPQGTEVKSNVIFTWTCSDLISYIVKIGKALPLTVQ